MTKEAVVLATSISKAQLKDDSFKLLAQQSSTDLLEALGQKVGDTAGEVEATANFDAKFDLDKLTRGAMSDVGRRVFQRWSRSLHQLICSPAPDELDIRDKLVRAITGQESGAAILAGLLVASFGTSPAVAALLATLFIKVLAEPANEEICKVWAERMAKAAIP